MTYTSVFPKLNPNISLSKLSYIAILSSTVPLSSVLDASALVVPISQLASVRTQLTYLATRPLILAYESGEEYSEAFYSLAREYADAILTTNPSAIKELPVVLLTSSFESISSTLSNNTVSVIAVSDFESANSVTVYTSAKSTASQGSCKLVRSQETVPQYQQKPERKPLVKVCGIQSVEQAKTALDAGADMIGMILVPGRSRTVSESTARSISDFVHSYNRVTGDPNTNSQTIPYPGQSLLDYSASRIVSSPRPLIVGVFRNQPLSDVINLQRELSLDAVQFHGDEPLEWCRLVPCLTLKRFTPGTSSFNQCMVPGYFDLALLDGELGGEGKMVDRGTDALGKAVDSGVRFVLAGGLTPDNVAKIVVTKGVIGVDVSGGVETDGKKDLEKIKKFVTNAKIVNIL